MKILKTFWLIALYTVSCSVFAVKPSGTLPVMYINTSGGQEITSKETYLDAEYWLDPMGIEGVEAFGSAAEPLKTQIKGRGNYTWKDFKKKPYRVKLDKKAALLGLDKSKHFALMAHADDGYGFLRDALGFKISELMGMPWTPKQEPVELVLNGDYVGLYFLTENIRVDADRVDVVEQPDEATDPAEITGGWLVEIDNYNSDPHVTVPEKGQSEPYDIWFTYKTPEVLSAEQEDYLTSQMSAINDLVYDSETFNCRWASYVDLDILARFYVVQEVMDNRESFHGSCYMYKQQGDDQKWKFGPVWDFGCTLSGDKDRFIYQGWCFHQVWIGRMCEFTEFMYFVKNRWVEFYENHYYEMLSYINDFAERIKDAAVSDHERWPEYGHSDEMNRAKKVADIIKGNCSWLSKQWGGQEPVDPGYELSAYFVDNTSKPWEKVYAYSWALNTQPLGPWPGTKMTPAEVKGKPGWEINFTVPTGTDTSKLMIIFGDGQSGVPQHQTGDLKFDNGMVYYRDESGLSSVSVADEPLVFPLRVSTIDGRSFTVSSEAELSSLRGFYILPNKKLYITR